MAIFVVGDLHLSLGGDKPMDVFEGWEGYLPKLEANWRTLISPQDTVILAGDTSWAMKLEDTKTDFAFIQNLPGQKWLLKGNHDYWWTTITNMKNYLKENSFIVSDFQKYLEPLKDKIDWQKGKYDFTGEGNLRSIMDIQNTSKDIDLFKNYLLHQL